jgi:hypothetical protein
MLMIAQLLYSKQRALALKGFGFLELLPTMAVLTQQKVIAVDNALAWNPVDALLKWSMSQKEKEKAQLLERAEPRPNPVTPLTQLT